MTLSIGRLGGAGRGALGLCLVVAIGCGDDDGSNAALSTGEASTVDASAARIWMPGDAGIPPRPEGGVEPDDQEATGACFPAMAVPQNDLPQCTSATYECATTCEPGDDDCRNGCYSADTSAPREGYADGCEGCVNTQALFCASENGCDAEINRFFCCLVEKCSTGGESCLEEMCLTELQEFLQCAQTRAPQCFDITQGGTRECFGDGPEEGPDAGMGQSTDAGVDLDSGTDDADAGVTQ